MKRILKKLRLLLAVFVVINSYAGICGAEAYLLRSGDQLSINVWGYDEFQAKEPIVVKPDGNIAFPLVGEVPVAGLTTEQAAKVLRQSLAEFLTDPKVAINIVKFGGTRVYVLGEVPRPGLYEIEKQHNVLDAISIAGGFTKDAAKKKVFLIRKNQKGDPIKVDMLSLLKKGDMSQNHVLGEGDALFITNNNRVDFAKDILPLFTAYYYVENLNN